MSDMADRIRNVRFKPVRLREGYDMGEVDAFLDRLDQAVGSGEPVGPLVEGARFTKVRMREGYDIDEVEQFLNEFGSRPLPAPQEPAGVVNERQGILGRLFGRR